MKEIKINNTFPLNLDVLIESRLLVQANSGGGKSWLIRRLLEQSHGKVQQIVIDIEGEFSTLREKYEYVLVGKGGDTPATVRSAALLARKLLELKVSAIIDLSELQHQERKQYVKLFLDSMIDAPKDLWNPCLVVIDEAHQFAPEQGESVAASAVIDLCTRGRKRGFCAVLATQRISKLAKDAAAECNNKIIGRASQDIDMKRAADELGFRTKEQMLSLRSLGAGEFYAFGPAICNEPTKMKVGDVNTSHPKVGSRSLSQVTPPTPKILAAIGKLADLPQEAEKQIKTMQDLQKEINTLKSHKCPPTNIGPSSEEIEKQMKDYASKVLTDIEKAFDEELKRFQKMTENTRKSLMKINENVDQTIKYLIDIDKPDFKRPELVPTFKNIQKYSMPAIKNTSLMSIQQNHKDYIPGVVMQKQYSSGETKVSNPQQKILDSIAWLKHAGFETPTKNQVAFLADQSPTSSGYSNNLSSLRTQGLIAYPHPGELSLTQEGDSIAMIPLDVITTQDLHERIKNKLPRPQWSIIQSLIRVYPEHITKAVLADDSGQSASSSGYSNNLSALRTLGLLDYPSPGMVVARSILFLD